MNNINPLTYKFQEDIFINNYLFFLIKIFFKLEFDFDNHHLIKINNGFLYFYPTNINLLKNVFDIIKDYEDYIIYKKIICLIPICFNDHWTLIKIHYKNNYIITYYNSRKQNNYDSLDILNNCREYFYDNFLFKTINTNKQNNYNNCGFYCLIYIFFIFINKENNICNIDDNILVDFFNYLNLKYS